MDDLTPFDHQIAAEFLRDAGPSEPVDDLAVFDAITAATNSHRWGFAMFSAFKFVAAGVIVALFGGFLLAGALTAPQNDDTAPAAVTDSLSPTMAGELGFPTGTFESEEDGLRLEFRADGTCQRADVPCTFGVTGDLYSEMTFEDPAGAQVPATYYWDFDGEHLTFESWGDGQRPSRRDAYANHTYRLVEAGEPLLPATETDFPTGTLVEVDSRYSPRLILREDGTYQASVIGTHVHDGFYVVNGNLYTEMTNDSEKAVAKVPATYRWDWDGERLTFSPWGVDEDGYRKAIYTDHVYVMDEGSGVLGKTRRLLLSHPQLDVWVTVEITPLDAGGHEAIATIDNEPLGEGVGDTPQEAVRAALEALGEPYASDIAEDVKG